MKIKVRHICRHEDEFDLNDHISKYLEYNPDKLKHYIKHLAKSECVNCYVKSLGVFEK